MSADTGARERLVELAEELILDIEDTCDCDDHVAQIKVYRERLAALAAGVGERCRNCGVPTDKWTEIACFDGHSHVLAGGSVPPAEALARIRAVVDEQAENEALWAIHPSGRQPIVEAYLQQELRRLHAAVEAAGVGVPPHADLVSAPAKERQDAREGSHACLTEEDGWRPCPSSLCQAGDLLGTVYGLRDELVERRACLVGVRDDLNRILGAGTQDGGLWIRAVTEARLGLVEQAIDNTDAAVRAAGLTDE